MIDKIVKGYLSEQRPICELLPSLDLPVCEYTVIFGIVGDIKGSVDLLAVLSNLGFGFCKGLSDKVIRLH